MKKIVTLLLALSMIIAVSFTLSSCDVVNQYLPGTKEDEKTDNTEDEGNTENGDNTEDDGNTENGDNIENGDNTTEVRTTVTAEEWTANMEQTNFTVTADIGEGTETTVKGIISITATNKSVEVLEPEEQMTYFAIQDGKSYYVIKVGESWSGGNSQSYPYDTVYEFVTDGVGGSNTFEFEYDDFVYNAEIKAYVYSFEDEAGDEWTYRCYFEDGKIVKAEINKNITNYDGTETSIFAVEIFSDLGTTVVEVPEFSIFDTSNDSTEGDEDDYGNDSQEN